MIMPLSVFITRNTNLKKLKTLIDIIQLFTLPCTLIPPYYVLPPLIRGLKGDIITINAFAV